MGNIIYSYILAPTGDPGKLSSRDSERLPDSLRVARAAVILTGQNCAIGARREAYATEFLK